MQMALISIAAILLAITLVNCDKEEHSNYYSTLKQAKHLSEPDKSSPRPLPPVGEDNADSTCALKVKCNNEKGSPGVTGAPGIPGLSGLMGLRGRDGYKGEKGERGLSGGSPPVVFFTAMDKNMGPLSGETLLYKSVSVNIRSAYDPDNGMFTAPSSGSYIFNIVVAAQAGKSAAVQLRKTGGGSEENEVVVLAESLPSWGTSSNSVYLFLNQGQQVYLIAKPNLQSYYYASMYTTFSGHLVTPAQ